MEPLFLTAQITRSHHDMIAMGANTPLNHLTTYYLENNVNQSNICDNI